MSLSPREAAETMLDHWSRDAPLPRGLLAPDIEWVNPPDAVEPGTRHGHEGFGSAEENWRGSFSSIRFEIEGIVDSGDQVAATVRCYSVARGSGMEVDQVLGFLWTVREGRITRFEWSNDAHALLRRLPG